MTSTVRNVAFDCADPCQLARFWSAVTGYPPDDEFCVLRGPADPPVF